MDSNDRDRIEEARQELHHTCSEEEMKASVVLIFANKQDLPNAMSVAEVEDKLDVALIRQQGRSCHVMGCCATSGDGLYEGLECMHSQLRKVVNMKK